MPVDSIYTIIMSNLKNWIIRTLSEWPKIMVNERLNSKFYDIYVMFYSKLDFMNFKKLQKITISKLILEQGLMT